MGPIKLKNVSQKLTSYVHELKGSQSALKNKEPKLMQYGQQVF